MPTQVQLFVRNGLRYSLLVLAFMGLAAPLVLAQISVSFSLDEPTCFGLPDGSVTATASGGTAPYSYSWNTGQVGATISGVPAGVYSVTVTDAAANTTSASVTLNQPPLVTLNLAASDVCSAPFTINSNAGGGVPPYGYNWSTGASTPSISNVPAGTYCVTVVDENNCGATDCITVTANPPDVTITKVNVTCPGDNDGSLTAVPNGGTAPFTYLWSNGATTQTINNLGPGTYSVTLTDASGCTATATAVLSSPPDIFISVLTADPSCPGDTNGSITTTVTGGTPPYTYLWSNGATTANIFNLGPGLYTLTVTDANGCTEVATVTLVTLSNLSLTASANGEICPDANDGKLTATATGGVDPISYLWSNGATTAMVNNVAPGTYTVTATDAAGCMAVASATVTEAPDYDLSIQVTDVDCFSGETGAIDLTVSGGTPPYTYLWSNGATTEDLMNLTAGTYTVTVTDANSCPISISGTVNQPTDIMLSAQVTDIDCFGNTTGAIDLTVSGGTPPYTFLWSNGATTEDLMNLAAGTYTGTVTDANGCTASATVTISEPTQIMLSATVTDVDCFGNSTGAVDLTVTGGTPPYTFVWSNGATTEDLMNLAAGSYTGTVTDANGCTASATVTVNEPTAIMLSATVTDVDCFGNETGAIDLTVSGGTPPYTFLWSNGATTEDLMNLAAGSYTGTVTDANGCTASATVTVNQPTDINLSAQVTDVDCFGNMTGAIDLTVSGGTPPYTFLWSNGATIEDLMNLAAGSYTGTVTDANGCTASATVTVNEPTQIMLSAQVTDVDCFGNETGAIDLTVTGGTPPYTFDWSNGATTEDLMNLAAGSYTGTVTDANGCTASATVTVNEPTAIMLSATVTDVDCFGATTGAIDLTVMGGTPPYTFNWSNGATTEDLMNLAAGSYTGTVTDANGCTASATVTVNEPTQIMLSAQVTDVDCFGNETGAIDLTVSGGTPPYTFSWSNGATTEDLMNLAAGDYTGTVTDANGCTASATVIVNEPTAIMLSAQVTDVDCFGNMTGAIDLTVSGGTPPYTFLWSNGATTEDLMNLAAGDYTGTVTDANGCTASATVTVNEPTQIMLSATVTDVDCSGNMTGAIDLTVTGGTPPYTFIWSNGATTEDLMNLAAGDYTGTVTDANGCTASATVTVNEPTAIMLSAQVTDVDCFGNSTGAIDLTVSGGTPPYTFLWSNGATTEDLMNLAAGSYTGTVTDANGCTASATVTVNEPTAIMLSATVTDVDCFGNMTGAIDLTVSGGTPPYTFSWSNGAITEDLMNLAAGSYTGTVTDANGCTASATVTVNEPTQIMLSAVTTNVTCPGDSDGSIDLTVSGGTAPYTFAWSNGATTEDLTGLAAGSYTGTVTDANGCTASATVTITEPEALDATIDAPLIACGGDTGSATVFPSGGTGPYTYEWSDGQTTQTATNLPAGVYSVTISDANGCKLVLNGLVLSETPELELSFQVINIDCSDDNIGSITVQAMGGTEPYTYAWSNGETTATISGLAPGTYTVTVTDANDCSAEGSATVTQTPPAAVDINVTNVLCAGDNNGSLTAVFVAGTMPVSYIWSTGATGATISNLAPGTYSVTMTDANECTASASATITEPTPIMLSGQVIDVTCEDDDIGAINLTVSGGTPPYTYSWSNGQVTEDIQNLMAGSYTVTVTDANGCTATATFVVGTPDDCPAKLGDFVWLDDDRDGIQDPGEPGIPGVKVIIESTEPGNTFMDMMTTDANGMYMFMLDPGTYKLTFELPDPTFTPSPQNQGGDDALDSDVDPDMLMTAPVTLSSGEINLTIDAGFYPKCDNVDDPGEIGFDQMVCGPGVIPDPFVNIITPSGGSGQLEYLWMMTTGDPNQDIQFWTPIPNTNSPTYQPGPIFETTFFTRCVRRECCITYLESNILTITVGDDAVADINGPEIVCEGEPATFTAAGAGAGATIEWVFGDGATPETATGPTATTTWSSFGVFTVELYVTENGCTSYDVFTVTVSNSPGACGTTFSINAEVTNLQAGEVMINWEMENIFPDYSYTIEYSEDADNFVAIAEVSEADYEEDRMLQYSFLTEAPRRGYNFYRVVMRNDQDLEIYSDIEEVILTNDSEIALLYPNPVNTNLTLELFDIQDVNNVSIEITAANGVLMQRLSVAPDAQRLNMNFANYPAGAYFIRLRLGNTDVKTMKVLKY